MSCRRLALLTAVRTRMTHATRRTYSTLFVSPSFSIQAPKALKLGVDK